MEKKDLYTEVFEYQSLNQQDALTYLNFQIGKALDKQQMIELLTNSVDKLKTLCLDMKIELRINEANPLVTLNSKKFYSTKEAAQILEISPEKIRQLVANGILTAKIINQRTWKLPSWSVEAYKNDLCNFLSSFPDSIAEYDVLDIIDNENQIIESLLPEDTIRKVFEYGSRIQRKVNNIFLEL